MQKHSKMIWPLGKAYYLNYIYLFYKFVKFSYQNLYENICPILYLKIIKNVLLLFILNDMIASVLK